MENYFHHFKAILAGIMIALLITSANYFLGMLIHLITDRGQRDFFSTGSMIIFTLVFISSYVYMLQEFKKS